jgi:hypothetical protein
LIFYSFLALPAGYKIQRATWVCISTVGEFFYTTFGSKMTCGTLPDMPIDRHICAFRPTILKNSSCKLQSRVINLNDNDPRKRKNLDKMESSQSVKRFLIGLAALILITIAIITTLGKPAPGGDFLTQTTGMPNSEEEDAALPDTSATQTRAFLKTQRALLAATEFAATHTPWNTPIIPPTGISTDVQVKFSGEN